MTEYVCSDLFGFFLLITKVGKNEKIKYLFYTNIYDKFAANHPIEFIEEILNIFSIKYELIYLKCHVPVISERTLFNTWFQKYETNKFVICPYNTYPTIKTKKRVELIYDPQSFFYKFRQDKKGDFLYKSLRFLYRKNKYSALSKQINLVSPHVSFFNDCKNILDFYPFIKTYPCSSFWDIFKGLYYKSKKIKSFKKKILNLKPNYIYLPSAEITDDQFFYLFNIQLQSLKVGSRILIKPHPRDKRNYSYLINKLNLKNKYKIIFTEDYEFTRFFPLEMILSFLNHEVILFGQCASTNFFNPKYLNIFCYGYPEPELSEFKEDYEFLHNIYSYEPFLLGEH